MTEVFGEFSDYFVRHLFYLAASSDLWRLANKCTEYIIKAQEPLTRSAFILDDFLTNFDDQTDECYDNEQLLLRQTHAENDENNENGYRHRYNSNRRRPGALEHFSPTRRRVFEYENLQYPDENDERNRVETLSNGSMLQSPANNNGALVQRENMQVTQPCSAPSSPLSSPGALSAISFTMPPSSSTGLLATIDTTDPNWQATKPTVRERNSAMFANDLMADIKFVVGCDDHIQTIPAHKYVLAIGSSVFYAMFYGGLAENKQEINVPDVEPSAFLTLLRYLYCDEIQLEADNVLATLYAAKKYIVPHLAKACVNYLETSLTAKNACLLLSQSRLFEEPDLMQRCWEVIDAQAEMAIKSEGFVDIDLKTFESILSRETLNCKEINLFEAALNWATTTCIKMEIDTSSQNKRNVLNQALHMIRIPTMTLEEFANGVAQIGILTPQETIDIFLHFTARNKPHLGFPIKSRAGLKTQICHRFQSCAYRSNQWRYRGRCDSIQFSVDKRIFMVGFGLYGSSTGAADYNVKIELKRLGRVLAENNTKFFSDGSSNTFHVFFENPIQIEADSYYTASVILDGSELSFFGQEGMTEVCMGNVTFQFQSSSESTNGTGVQGGQIPELIFYGPICAHVSSLSSLSSSSTSALSQPSNNSQIPKSLSSNGNMGEESSISS